MDVRIGSPNTPADVLRIQGQVARVPCFMSRCCQSVSVFLLFPSFAGVGMQGNQWLVACHENDIRLVGEMRKISQDLQLP